MGESVYTTLAIFYLRKVDNGIAIPMANAKLLPITHALLFYPFQSENIQPIVPELSVWETFSISQVFNVHA